MSHTPRKLTFYICNYIIYCGISQEFSCKQTINGEFMNTFEKIYEAVKTIPKGRVATYGQIAVLAGSPKWARAVGNALHKNPDKANIPCHRVVNGKGEVSKNFAFGGAETQIKMLESEGIVFGANGKIDLEKYGIK